MFNSAEWEDLSRLFTPSRKYAGYKPEVLEAPNGDGKVDVTKRYLHVALKYNPEIWAVRYLARAHFQACRIAEVLGVPSEYYPKVEDGTLRVLDYPAGAGSEEHTDFDLFTVHCYRSHPDDFERLDPVDPVAEEIDPDVHIGEIGELVGLGKATRHRVPARPYRQQAIVYFAMPSLAAELRYPSPGVGIGGMSVRDWLKERYARSRVYK